MQHFWWFNLAGTYVLGAKYDEESDLFRFAKTTCETLLSKIAFRGASCLTEELPMSPGQQSRAKDMIKGAGIGKFRLYFCPVGGLAIGFGTNKKTCDRNGHLAMALSAALRFKRPCLEPGGRLYSLRREMLLAAEECFTPNGRRRIPPHELEDDSWMGLLQEAACNAGPEAERTPCIKKVQVKRMPRRPDDKRGCQKTAPEVGQEKMPQKPVTEETQNLVAQALQAIEAADGRVETAQRKLRESAVEAAKRPQDASAQSAVKQCEQAVKLALKAQNNANNNLNACLELPQAVPSHDLAAGDGQSDKSSERPQDNETGESQKRKRERSPESESPEPAKCTAKQMKLLRAAQWGSDWDPASCPNVSERWGHLLRFLPPSDLLFAHAHISRTFRKFPRKNQPLEMMLADLVSGKLDAANMTPLVGVEEKSKIWIVSGNRRLWVFKKYEDLREVGDRGKLLVPVYVHSSTNLPQSLFAKWVEASSSTTDGGLPSFFPQRGDHQTWTLPDRGGPCQSFGDEKEATNATPDEDSSEPLEVRDSDVEDQGVPDALARLLGHWTDGTATYLVAKSGGSKDQLRCIRARGELRREFCIRFEDNLVVWGPSGNFWAFVEEPEVMWFDAQNAPCFHWQRLGA
mmetsp:Transcript_32214/g.74317  ORF Transcript_32214/g.74317 Transcript_32214/m.74317 type:complete len:631 (-) Transcript_32214:6-1898(-)